MNDFLNYLNNLFGDLKIQSIYETKDDQKLLFLFLENSMFISLIKSLKLEKLTNNY